MSLKATEVLPKATEVLPKATEVLPKATEVLPKATDVLPGNTILPPEEYENIVLPQLTKNKKTIILATNDVNDDSLFLNGLTQNILILYQLFEAIGYSAYLLQNGTTTPTEKRAFINEYKTVSHQGLLTMHTTHTIHAFIEVGMSIQASTRGYLKSVGAKIFKLYLGNIINIDIETIQNYPNMFFNHHLVGELDEIWTSPHYMQHIDYAAILNRIDIEKGKIVPYVWDPCFLKHYKDKNAIDWQPSDWKTMDVVIMDPNISFQKCSFYSLLLLEAFSKRYPEWKGNIQVINGDRLKLCAHARNVVLPSLSLYHQDRIKLQDRKKIHTILEENRSACFITHQWNNDYNYMTLELLYCNYPILHNSQGWSPYGYYYDINEWDKAIDTCYNALRNHNENMYAYKTHAQNVIWKHSVYNPSIQERWRELL
jgi:Protein of unknown function (DUF2827)